MSQKKSVLFIVLLFGLLMSCTTKNPSVSVMPIGTITTTIVNTPMSISSTITNVPTTLSIEQATLTSIPFTPTVIDSVTAQPSFVPTVTEIPLSSDAQVLRNILISPCISTEELLPHTIDIPWNLLVTQGGSVYILDLEDGTKTEVPYFSEKTSEGYNKFSYEFFVSPDGEWLAYPDIRWSELIVEPAKSLLMNEDTDRLIWKRELWFQMMRWVNNDTVLVLYPRSENSYFPTVFLNPFTDEEQVFLLEEMPNYLDINFSHLGHYLHSGELVPDPTMKRIIYPEWGNDEEMFTTLWDIENERPLARLDFYIENYNDPIWSQDGSNAIVLAPNPNQFERGEWFLLDKDGVVRQVTQFGEFLQNYYHFSVPNRSWDGRFLFFQLDYEESEENSKYILLDIYADNLEGYCLSVSSVGNSGYQYPVWSPDSKYVVISDTDRFTKGNIFFVDADNQAAYTIAQDMRIIGWISKP